jgi:predicted phosphodiesterase
LKILAIPDLHCPFNHPDAIQFLRHVRDSVKPDRVVCLGDEIDAAAWLRYDKDPQGMSPTDELRRARETLARLNDLFPRLMVCESNHTIRPWKKAAAAGLTDDFLVSPGVALGCPDWEWRPRWEIDGMVFMHGEGFSGPTAHVNAARQNRKSTVIGHIHAHAGVNYLTGYYDSIFAVNAGCLINPRSRAFDYGKHLLNRPWLGCAVIDNGTPFLLPMR